MLHNLTCYMFDFFNLCVGSKDWVVYSKKPVTADVVLDYLGRYVHRVAISKRS